MTPQKWSGTNASRQPAIRHWSRIATQLRVALAHQPEGVLVEAHPEVKAVLLDAIAGPAPRGALATEAKASW